MSGTIIAIMYTILAIDIMSFWILLRIQLYSTIQRAIILFFQALTNMLDIIRKSHFLQLFRAIILFTRDNNWVSHAYSESHHWLRFCFFCVTKWTMIFSIFFLFPLLIAIFASDSNFTFHAHIGLMGKLCAYAAFKLVWLLILFFNCFVYILFYLFIFKLA